MIKIILSVVIMLSIGASSVYAGADSIINSSPNYLILLVHGVNTPGWMWRGGKLSGDTASNGSNVRDLPASMRGFGDLLGYLRNDLGLDGYVYYYTFHERDGRIADQARELGDPNYNNPATSGSIMNHKGLADQPDITPSNHPNLRRYLKYPSPNIDNPIIFDIGADGKGNSWFEQARIDFKQWYANKYVPDKDPNKVPGSVIPNKYIIIAHSMGGLTAREYLSSDYYQGSVEAFVAIDSQHLGSTGALALRRVKDFYDSGEYKSQMYFLMGATLTALWAGLDEVAIYTGFCASFVPFGQSLIDEFYTKGSLGWYPLQPGVQDMDPQSSFINGLNSKPFINSSAPIKVRLISGRGIPTPSGDLPLHRYMIGLEAIQTVLSTPYLNDLPLGGKLMAVYMSVLLGAIMNQDGDIYGTNKSQLAEGLIGLAAPNINLKKYTYTFGEDSDILTDAILGVNSVVVLANAVSVVGGGPGNAAVKWGIIVAGAASAVGGFQYRMKSYLAGHGLIIEKIYEEKIIDHALEDIILVGGQSSAVSSSSSRSGISAASIRTTTAGFTAPEQAFSLLSNKKPDGSDAGSYHTVTIEAITESNNHYQAAPIVFGGQKKWVSGVTVKEAPTALKGVINTFLPKKLKSFEYSENFAAWKPVGTVDEWGNFTVKDLNFAEGQNVISFKAESWVGNKMNQILNITLNTIPMLPSGFLPAPNSYTNNNRPRIGATFAKAAYSASALENIAVETASLTGPDGIEKDLLGDPGFRFIVSGGTYDKRGTIEYIPDAPLLEGQYTMRVVVRSNVGRAQALWPFTIDTTPPSVKFLPSR